MAEKELSPLEQQLIKAKKDKAENRIIEDKPKHIGNLKKISVLYSQEYNFQKGDIVVWKEGLKNKLRPAYGEPCIVLDILTEPVLDKEKNTGSPYFNESLNLVLGIIDEDDDFLVFHYDSKRFEPYKES